MLGDHQRADLAYNKVIGNATYSHAAWKGLREVHAATKDAVKLTTALQELVRAQLPKANGSGESHPALQRMLCNA